MENYDRIIEQFHAMYDNFPERARLITKSHQVLAVNKAAADQGMAPGGLCTDGTDPKSHAGCRGILALKEGKGQTNMNVAGNRMRFWVPIDGCDDAFVHFSLPVDMFK